MAEKKEKQYVSDNAQLMAEWDWEKNKHITPEALTLGNNKKIWWKCAKGHEWQATVNNRRKGHGCPYCTGQKASCGINDLLTVNPALAKEWNFERNNGLSPAEVLPYSNRKVWWKCAKGHEWKATVNHRSNGTGCPICNSDRHTSFAEYALVYYLGKSGLDVIHSYKDNGYELDVYIPSKRIAIEYDGYYWHNNKVNNDIQKNHKCHTDGIILYRIREGLFSLNDTSIDFIVRKDKKDLPQILKKLLSEITDADIDIDLTRDALDIENLRDYTEKEKSLLFSKPKLAAEWNFEKNGNLKPEHVTLNSAKKVWWKCEHGHEWQAKIDSRNSGNGCPYCAGRKVLSGYNDLFVLNPSLAAEWDFEKNGKLEPNTVSANSHEKVWWKCYNGHTWSASIKSRNKGSGCPYCAGKKAKTGVNDLLTVNPSLAVEWNYDKNNGLLPEYIMPSSGKKVWWKCAEGHEWQATIDSRSKGHGCPFCSGLRPIMGKTDLQTCNPSLANEWNYEKNGELTPQDVSHNSHEKIWWKCSNGHEWQATIYNRNNGRGCPVCSGKKIVAGINDLATIMPELAKQWHPTKNNELTASNVSKGSDKKVWWLCDACGHEWQAVIGSRSRGAGCPQCAKKKKRFLG